MKNTTRKIVLLITITLLFYILAGWKIPVIWCMESLNLPEDSRTVYRTKIQISDVYWLHTKGEKVIRCDAGYEAAKAYIEEHNSGNILKYIDIYPYGECRIWRFTTARMTRHFGSSRIRKIIL